MESRPTFSFRSLSGDEAKVDQCIRRTCSACHDIIDGRYFKLPVVPLLGKRRQMLSCVHCPAMFWTARRGPHVFSHVRIRTSKVQGALHGNPDENVNCMQLIPPMEIR